jgi:hypothetical protein
MEHIVIIGNGIGVTLAHIRKNQIQSTIVSARNEFFFSRTALMYIFMGHMKFEHTHNYENDFGKKYQFSSKLSLTSVKTEKRIC